MLISHYIHYFVYFLLFLVLSLLNSITNKKYLLVFESSCVFAYMHTYTCACLQRDVWSFSWNDVGRTKSKRVHHVAFNIYQLTHASQIHKTRKNCILDSTAFFISCRNFYWVLCILFWEMCPSSFKCWTISFKFSFSFSSSCFESIHSLYQP